MNSIFDARRAFSKRQEAKASQQRVTGRDCKLVRKCRTTSLWRNGRVAEGAPLLRAYTLIAYRGFESLFLRQMEIYSHLNHRVNGLSGNIPPKLPPIVLFYSVTPVPTIRFWNFHHYNHFAIANYP